MKSDSLQNDSNDSHPDCDQVQRRQTWKVVLAILLIWIAVTSTSSAIDPCLVPEIVQLAHPDLPIQYDGLTLLSVGDQLETQDLGSFATYVQLQAQLSNFDADEEADGWQAVVVLRNRAGLPLAVPSRATFEILQFSRESDRLSTGQRVARSTPPIRWTMPLVFDEQNVARITLAAWQSVQHSLGWDSIGAHLVRTSAASGNHRLSGGRMSRLSRPRYDQSFVTLDLRDAIDFPAVGWLQVRVTIPGQKNLRAIAPIELRPPVLVDTAGPYR